MTDTKQKILDAAEELFGEIGYSATSMRNIISTAGVNLAAIHYHFGSKEDLLDHVIRRKLDPINQHRLQLLDQFETEAAPECPPIDKILDAFLVPAILAEKNRSFVKFMGRIHAEGLGQQAAMRNFQPLIDRFLAALGRALPNMSKKELAWKVHFMLGAMAFTMTAQPAINPEAAGEPMEVVSRRLVTFLSAGFRAPALQGEIIEVNK
jgi:AcrR family transcriptional regulator